MNGDLTARFGRWYRPGQGLAQPPAASGSERRPFAGGGLARLLLHLPLKGIPEAFGGAFYGLKVVFGLFFWDIHLHVDGKFRILARPVSLGMNTDQIGLEIGKRLAKSPQVAPVVIKTPAPNAVGCLLNGIERERQQIKRMNLYVGGIESGQIIDALADL